MNVFISIVSHNQQSLIESLAVIEKLSDDFVVVIKSNTSLDDFRQFTLKNNVYWLNSDYGLGFGANNNLIYNYCITRLAMKHDDLFIVLNPDVYITNDSILRLREKIQKTNCYFSTVNLYQDKEFTIYDPSIREFPKLTTFIKSFILKSNPSIIDKALIKEDTLVDWAAGSFLAFRSSHYGSLNGFDEGYFMYCEDIDICLRSQKMGIKLTYFYDINAVHFSRSSNRNIKSKHFIWHIKSVIRYLLKKNIAG